MDKLTIEHLAAYLPYRLHFTNGNEIVEMTIFNSHDCLISDDFKPILRPLSDLTTEIEHNGEKFVPMKRLLKEVSDHYPQDCYNQDEQWIINDGYRAIGEMPHRKVQKLLEWHFDVFGLIDKGLAIDIKEVNNA